MGGQLDSMKSQLGDVQSRLGSLETTVADLKGDFTERTLRESVEKLYGRHFSELFCIEGLNGLARIIGTQKTEYRARMHHEGNEVQSDTELIEDASRRLAASLKVFRVHRGALTWCSPTRSQGVSSGYFGSVVSTTG